ncbi:MAG: hypothetical protein ACTSPD_13970 [Promethearchaeota archaeon]
MERRFLLPLILVLITLFAGLGITISFGIGFDRDFSAIIPGPMGTDLIIAILIPFIFAFIALMIAHLIAFYFFRIHKVLKLGKYEYFIFKQDKNLSAFKIILRALIPGLLAINIGIYLASYGVFNQYFVDEYSAKELPIVIEMISVIIGIPIAIIIITPIWALDSSGLMCRKRIEAYNHPVNPDIESVGSFYFKFIKGYVGISTIAVYIFILYGFIQEGVTYFSFIIVFIDPFLVVLCLLPASLLLEMRLESIKGKLLSKCEAAGIDIMPKEIILKLPESEN